MAFVLFTTTFGICGIAWNDTGLTRFQLPGETEAATARRLGSGVGARLDEDEVPEWVRRAITRVRRHLDGEMQDFSDLALDRSLASEFQLAVYREALLIKPGSKRTYGQIAQAVGLGPAGARAVGVALAANPWPLVVPCHRVVSANGKMTGFSAPGGIRTKTRLLAIEGAELLSE
jgi:methylated-DNA-[protein]-cysteine S-methyltransferase